MLVRQQNLLHIGQEALTNTFKYACTGRFQARLNFNKKELRLELADLGLKPGQLIRAVSGHRQRTGRSESQSCAVMRAKCG